MRLTGVVWTLGGRVPRRVADAVARVLAVPLSWLPLPGVRDWEASVTQANAVAPSRRQRRALLENWMRNLAWSLSLARWSDEEVLRVAHISDDDVAKVRTSLSGPGLVLVLPHMGSWDLAGAWCARVGIHVVSVAERLPNGLFERFRDARAAMGMRIYALDQPGLMGLLADDVRAGSVVCLLGDRDLSARGIAVQWPRERGTISVPAGPALLARRTGADLRVVTTHFEGDRLRMLVSDPVAVGRVEETATAVVAGIADAVASTPQDWLMLRRVFSSARPA